MYQVDPKWGMAASTPTIGKNPTFSQRFNYLSGGGSKTVWDSLFMRLGTDAKRLFPGFFKKDSAVGPSPTDVDPGVLASQKELSRRLALAQGRKSTVITGGITGNPTISRMGLMGMP